MEIAAVRGKSCAVMPPVLTATAARLVQTERPERRIMLVRTGLAPAFPLTANHAICKLRDACSSYWRSSSALPLVAIPTIALPLLSVEKSSRTPGSRNRDVEVSLSACEGTPSYAYGHCRPCQNSVELVRLEIMARSSKHCVPTGEGIRNAVNERVFGVENDRDEDRRLRSRCLRPRLGRRAQERHRPSYVPPRMEAAQKRWVFSWP